MPHSEVGEHVWGMESLSGPVSSGRQPIMASLSGARLGTWQGRLVGLGCLLAFITVGIP